MASRWELKTWKVTLDGSPEDYATKHGGILNLVLGCFRYITAVFIQLTYVKIPPFLPELIDEW